MKKKWAVVLDFDGTLINSKYISLYNVIDQAIHQPAYSKKVDALRSYYLGKVAARPLTRKEQMDWFNETIRLYIDFGITMRKMEKVLKEVKLNRGVKECLKRLMRKETPVTIISYGIKQFIDIVLKSNGVEHLISRVYSAELLFDKSRRFIRGFKKNTLILPDTKKTAAREFAKANNVPWKNVLGIGDSRHDAGLAKGKSNLFGIARNKANEKILKKYMGVVAVSNDFYPATNWLMEKIGLTEKPKKDENEHFCSHPDCGVATICPECRNFMPRPYKTGN